MFKRVIRGGLLFLLLVLVLVGGVTAQPANAIGMQPGKVETPWSAFPLTAPITSQSYSLAIGTQGVPAITWQVTTPSAPTSFTANLQASNDGTTYATIDTTTAVGIRTVFGTYKFIQFTVSATSGGSSPTITISTVYSRGNAVSTTSGAIYGGGTFTGPILLPAGSISNLSLRFPSAGIGLFEYGGGYLGLNAVGAEPSMLLGSSIIVQDFGGFYWSTNPGAIAADLALTRDAANTLALKGVNGTNAQTFNIYNTYTDASNYERLSIQAQAAAVVLMTQNAGTGSARALSLGTAGSGRWVVSSGGTFPFYPAADDSSDIGGSANRVASLYTARSIQGSKSKSLTDAAAAVSIWRIAVPTNGYAGGKVIFTANSTDGTDRLTTTGEVTFAGADTAGTVTCGIGTPYGLATAYRRANTLVCTFTAVTSTTNCDVQVTCTDNLAGAQTMAIESRLDMPTPNTVTPQ